MSSRLDVAYRDREHADRIRSEIEPLIASNLDRLKQLSVLTPIAPLECDRHDPLGWNRQLSSYSRALSDQAQARAALARETEALLDLLIDPNQVAQDRERERLELLDKQEARSREMAERRLAIKEKNSEAYRETLTKKSDPDRKARQENQQLYADALALKRGLMDPIKAPHDVKEFARTKLGWKG